MVKSALWAIAFLIGANVAVADSHAEYDAVAALGELNGVALQCRYLDQVRRMKAAVVANALKERSFGMAFDEATNTAFLTFARDKQPCPGVGGFEEQVGERIEAMRQAFVDK